MYANMRVQSWIYRQIQTGIHINTDQVSHSCIQNNQNMYIKKKQFKNHKYDTLTELEMLCAKLYCSFH